MIAHPGPHCVSLRAADLGEHRQRVLPNQQWDYDNAFFDGAESLTNANGGKCVVTQGVADGRTAFQYYCGGWADQQWTMR